MTAETGEHTRAERITRLFLFSLAGGGMLGMLAFATMPFSSRAPTLGHAPIPFALAFSLVLGACVGIGCSPIVVFLLDSREVAPAKRMILWPTAAVVVLLSIMFGDRVFVVMGVSALTFLGSASVARWSLPRVFDTPGLCRRCGYDLRESYAFGRCPECGRLTGGLAETSNDAIVPETLARHHRFFAFLERRPGGPVLLVMGCLLAQPLFHDWRTAMRRRAVTSAASAAVTNNGTLDLAKAAAFEWDIVCVHAPYSNVSGIEKALGIEWAEAERKAGWIDPGEELLIFMRGQTIVEVVHLSGWRREAPLRAVEGFDPASAARAIPREHAVFRVGTSAESRRVFTLSAP